MPEDGPQPAEGNRNPPRDPFGLVLVVLAILVYAVGQWLTFTMLAEKLDTIEQRVVDTAARLETKVEAVDELLAARAQATPETTSAAGDPSEADPDAAASRQPVPGGSSDAAHATETPAPSAKAPSAAPQVTAAAR